MHAGAKGFHLPGEYGHETILDETVVYLVACDDEPDLEGAKRLDGKERTILAGDSGSPFDHGFLDDQRNCPCACNQFPFLDQGVVVERGAHDVFHHVEGRKGGGVHSYQPVPAGEKVDFPFPRLVFPENAVSRYGPGKNGCSLVFVKFVLCHFQDVEMILSQPLQVTEILVANDMAFAKSGPFELTGSDLRDVMCEFSAHGILQFDLLHAYDPLAFPKTRD
jgi:hypothetical protein